MRQHLLIFLLTIGLSASAQTWIWYPGDFEIWLGNEMNNRRTERGAFFPHFWKMDSHYNLVEFSKEIHLSEAEEIEIAVEGRFNVKLNGRLLFGMPHKLTLPAGKHQLNIKVYNQATPPALFVRGATIRSGTDWRVTYEDKEWIDESGKASDTSATLYMQAAGEQFNDIDSPPSAFKLSVRPQAAVSKEKIEGAELLDVGNKKITGAEVFDFGKETFGFLQIHGLKGKGKVSIYYGESREEAMDKAHCETLDVLEITGTELRDASLNRSQSLEPTYTLINSKAFRYVHLVTEGDVSYDDVSMLYEYRDVDYRGSFRCNDEEINRIWEVGAYTMHLTTREFFIDGIKRDRWVWSGDAIQSYLMNYYLFFDSETVRRSIWLLRGKDPVTSHINTIMDYSFYWFLSIYDYYMYTGDRQFVQQIYPRMQSMMEYVLGRTNDRGMVEGLTGDWVFVDWADRYMDKKGELSYEQVLFAKSLETMALCAQLAGNEEEVERYTQLFQQLKQQIEPAFWNDEKQALVHNSIGGVQQDAVTRYSNMFAVFFNYLPTDKQQQIKTSVLLNDNIMKISTPYMRFYELEALCALGEHESVTREIKAYWGGMLREGATSFWEKYNPDDSGKAHLSMYGRPYGKSLCHAWGASPIYLLGKYYLGIQAVKAGYEEFSIQPVLGGLEWMEGEVPTPNGSIALYMDQKQIRVKATEGTGYLTFSSRSTPKTNKGKIEALSAGQYRIRIENIEDYIITYKHH